MCACVRAFVCGCMRACVRARMCACVRVCVCVRVYVYLYVYVCMCCAREPRTDRVRTHVLQDMAFFDAASSGDISSRLTSDCQVIVIVIVIVTVFINLFINDVIALVMGTVIVVVMVIATGVVKAIAIAIAIAIAAGNADSNPIAGNGQRPHVGVPIHYRGSCAHRWHRGLHVLPVSLQFVILITVGGIGGYMLYR